MKWGKQSWVIVLGGMGLALAIGFQWIPARVPSPGKGRHLAGFLPATLTGWDSLAVPLGASEAGTAQVADVLRYDDVSFREYFHPGKTSFSLYVAYWNPGKMPVQLVASHTPDRCWVESGWKSLEANHRSVVRTSMGQLRPGQGRIFKAANGTVQHVLFWHLVGDELYDYGTRVSVVPSPWKWWSEVALGAISRPREQYFIRLSSERPLEELEQDQGFQELITRVGQLGLADRG